MSSLTRRYLISFDFSIFLLIRLHVTVIELNHELQVTCKYKCVVRIIAIYPWRAEDFRSPNGIYRVRVTLEDPTARIHAYIYKEDGVKKALVPLCLELFPLSNIVLHSSTKAKSLETFSDHFYFIGTG